MNQFATSQDPSALVDFGRILHTSTHEGTYAASYGPLDFVGAGLNYIGIVTPAVRQQINRWQGVYEANPNGYIIHSSHSRNTIQVDLALKHTPSCIKDRMYLIKMASFTQTNQRRCHSVYECQSSRDYACRGFKSLTGVIGYWRNRGSPNTIPAHPDAPLFDHSISGPTYFNEMVKRIHIAEAKIRDGKK